MLSRTAIILTLLAVTALPSASYARNVEAGKVIGFATVGPSFRAGSDLGGSGTFLLLGGGIDYPLDKFLALTGSFHLGLAGSQQTKLRGGARYRIVGLDLPVLPYIAGEVVLGRFYDVIGANLNFWGLRGSAGADYFLTAKFLAGFEMGWELTRTTGVRPTTFSQIDAVVRAGMVF